MADTTERKEYLIDVKTNYQKYIDELNAARKALEEQQVAQLRLTEEQKKDADFMAKFTAETRNLQTAVKNGTKIVDQATLANKAQEGSYEQLYRTWQVAQTRLKLLGGAYETNAQGVKVLSQKYVQYKADVENAKRGLDSFGKGVADNRLNVGNYSEAIEGAIGKFTTLPGVVGKAATAVQGFGITMKALLLNPVGLAITAIAGAVAGLIAIFKKFTPAVEAVERVMSGLKAVFTGISNAIIGLITGQKSLGETFRDLGKDIKSAYDEGVKWRQLEQDMFELTTENAVADAKRKTQIDELILASKNRSKTEEERMQLIEQALLLEEVQYAKQVEIADGKVKLAEMAITKGRQFTDEEIKMLQERGVEYANELKMIKNITEDEIQAYSDALVAREQVNTASVALREKAQNRADLLADKAEARREKERAQAEKDAEKAKADMEKAKANLTKELDDYKNFIAEKQAADLKAIEDKRQLELEQAEWERNRVAENQENLLQIREQNNEYAFDIQRARLEQQRAAEVQAAEQTGADINLINQKYAAAQRTIDETEAAAKLGLYADFAGNLATIFGKNTAIGKAAAVAQTTIATYQAAVESYKSLAGIPVVGVGLGIAAAAAAVVAGLANVKKILAVKSGLPGDAGGGGSAPTSISSSVPAQRTFATAVGSSFVTQPQLTQQQINALPAQPMITAEELAAAVAKLPAPIVSVEDINARSAEVQKVEVRGIV